MNGAGELVTAFVAAAGLGAVIGFERQIGHEAEGDAYAGARTFALYAVWGAAAGYFGDTYGDSAFLVAAAMLGALVVASYVFTTRRGEDPGTTTEAAALAAFAVGVLAWQQEFVAAVALSVGTTALLASKGVLHRISERFSPADVQAVLQFAVISAVVLPLVPNEDLGPFGAFNPFEIWLMVVFVSAIGLVGYVALRLLGSRGLTVTGLFGGLVSSTAVTLSFSRMSKHQSGLRRALAAGIIAASGLMYGRVLIEAAVIEPELARRLAIPLLVLFVAVEASAIFWYRRQAAKHGAEADLELENPLSFAAAVQFGALYAGVVFVSKALVDRVSETSLSLVGAVSGINDVDAITLSTADLVRDGVVGVGAGAQAILAAVIVNTLVKAGLAVGLGSHKLGRSVAQTLVPAATVAAVAWFIV